MKWIIISTLLLSGCSAIADYKQSVYQGRCEAIGYTADTPEMRSCITAFWANEKPSKI